MTRSVPVLKLPGKMHYSLILEYKSVTKKLRVSAENVDIKVSALIAPS